jgi:hypothetical protein
MEEAHEHLRAKGLGLWAKESCAPRKVTFPYFLSQSSERPLQSISWFLVEEILE